MQNGRYLWADEHKKGDQMAWPDLPEETKMTIKAHIESHEAEKK
jgi:hypothetical protein